MAQSLRRPLCSLVGLSSSLQRRPFTQVSPQWAAMRSLQAVRGAQRPEKAIKVLQKEQMSQGMIPSDMGLLQDTFVAPIRFPSIFKSPGKFVKLQYYRMRFHLRDLVSLMAMKWSSPRGKRWYNRVLKLDRSGTIPVAVDLHQQMYSAFADGDLPKLKEICTDGIYDSFRNRIGQRPWSEKVKWELLKYNKTAKAVSDRMAKLPVDGQYVRQVIVRIRSQQRLTRFVGGTQVTGTGVAKDVSEYVVVQCTVEKWKVGQWKVWGTTKETTLEDCEHWRRVAKAEKA